jgi:hypothetical protein
MTVTPLNGSSNNSDTFSSPYYDYSDDILYVGDDNGDLYKITPVFNSPATSPVATTVFAGFFHRLSSPVYDQISGCVFVGDSAGVLYSFNSGVPGGTVCTSSTFLLNATSVEAGAEDAGYHDGILLDPVAGQIYGFLTNGAGAPQCGSGVNCVVQFPTNFAGDQVAAPSGAEPIGFESYGDFLYSGTFDNVYYSSTSSASPSGNIWVVGNVNDYHGANLYQVPINSNVLGTPVATTMGFAISIAGNPPYTPNFATPITEFCNNGSSPCVASGGETTSGTDTIYFSINQGLASGCSSNVSGMGCVLAYNVNNPAAPTLTGQVNYAFPNEDGVSDVYGCWGTSAIVIDNASTSTGASEVYYMYFGGNGPSPGDANSICGTSTGGTAEAIQTLQSTL